MRKTLAESVDLISPADRERALPSYLTRILPKAQTLVTEDPPVTAHVSRWRYVTSGDGAKRSLTRQFTFESKHKLLRFVFDLLNHEDEVNHHSTILISGGDVTVTVHTTGVGDVTEIDLEFSHDVDDIYEDTLFSGG